MTESPHGEPPTGGPSGPEPGSAPPPYQPYAAPQGPPPPGTAPWAAPPLYAAPRPTNGLAIGALVASLVGVGAAFALCGVGGIVGLAGAIMGHVARGQIRERDEAGDGLALAGIIVGWVSVGIALLAVVAILVFVVAMGHSMDGPYSGTSV